jgi:hypothetical protein
VSDAISILDAFAHIPVKQRWGLAVNETNERFKRAKAPRKSASVKRVTLSDDAKKKYEDLVRARDEREQAYGRHLAEERKTKR